MAQSRQKVSQAVAKLRFGAFFCWKRPKTLQSSRKRAWIHASCRLTDASTLSAGSDQPLHGGAAALKFAWMPSAARKHCGSCRSVWRNARWTQQEIHAARRPGPSQTGPFTRKWGKQDVRSLKDTAFGANFCKLQRIVCKADSQYSDWLFVVWYWGTFSREGGVVSGRRPLRSFTKLTFYLFIADVKNKTHTQKNLVLFQKSISSSYQIVINVLTWSQRSLERSSFAWK